FSNLTPEREPAGPRGSHTPLGSSRRVPIFHRDPAVGKSRTLFGGCGLLMEPPGVLKPRLGAILPKASRESLLASRSWSSSAECCPPAWPEPPRSSGKPLAEKNG